MLSIIDLSKQYVTQKLFENVTFAIGPGERVGLVGRNGHGKTTLLKIIMGQEEHDSGKISISKNYSVGYLNQHISFTSPTVLGEACLGLPEDQKEDSWKAEKILSGLGFSKQDMERNPKEFSGGYQLRICLTKVLVSEPNLLLLDEPTNFLDIVSIRWLAQFLTNWKNEILFISHDRGLMDKIATHIVGIHRLKARKIEGNTHKYYEQIAKEEEIQESRRINEGKKQAQMEVFINKFRAKAQRGSLVQSRIKMLEKQQKIEKLEKVPTLSFTFSYEPFAAKTIMEARNVSFAYTDENFLINKFSVTVNKNDKICIIGKNGAGKTTLLKLFAQKLKPKQGEVHFHNLAKMSYFEQANTSSLNNNFTVEEEISASAPIGNKQQVRNICGIMMFSGDNALKKIGVLSGGEKCRVALGKLLVSTNNILLLDEPTHHLDMQSCESMLEAISNFEGAAIMVTHDEYFLNSIATKLIVFDRGTITVFLGTYQEFLEQVGWSTENESKEAKKKSNNNKESRREKAEFINLRSKTLKPFEIKITNLEKNIEQLENQSYNETAALVKASEEQNIQEITKLSKSIHELKPRIETLYEELVKTTEDYEKEKQKFENLE